MNTEHLLRPPMTYLSDLARFGELTQMWTRPIQFCLQCQADMFKATEPFATGWFERQLDATHLALENIKKLARCGDLTQAVSIQRQWFEAALKRLTPEFEKPTERASELSCEAASASRDATQSVAEAATSSRPAAQVKTAGKKKASQAKTKAASMAKTDSAGEAKIETTGEAKIDAAGEAIEVTVGAEVGQLETPATTEAKVEVAA
jgi:hypothetical protein